MEFFVYILRSVNFKRYYVGFTHDLSRRLNQHNERLSPSTAPFAPWQLKYFERYPNKTDAIKREKLLKKQRNHEFYEKLIKSNH